MSRWIENFQAHPFQIIWEQLKNDLNETKVSDETIITDVTELARLVKVISYVDGMIHSIDSELIPFNTWDNFRDQVSNCQQQIASYKSNRNISHINSANSHADNLLTYVRPYMIAEGKVGNVLQKAIEDYAKIITEYGNTFRNESHQLLVEIKKSRDDAESCLNTVSYIKKLTDELNIELFGENLDDGIQEKIKILVSDFELKQKEIGSLYNEIFIGDEENISTKKKISMANEAITDDQKSIKEILKNVENKIVELNDFHSTIFGDQKDEKENSGGLLADFNARIEGLKSFEIEQKIKYNALNQEIETLLPGATSAGLASAYSEMKDSFNKPIKYAVLTFYISLFILIIVAIWMSVDSIGGEHWITFSKPDDWDAIFKKSCIQISAICTNSMVGFLFN